MPLNGHCYDPCRMRASHIWRRDRRHITGDWTLFFGFFLALHVARFPPYLSSGGGALISAAHIFSSYEEIGGRLLVFICPCYLGCSYELGKMVTFLRIVGFIASRRVHPPSVSFPGSGSHLAPCHPKFGFCDGADFSSQYFQSSARSFSRLVSIP